MSRVLPAVLLAAALGACTEEPPAPKPYVVTAIDYHFHDAHPSLPIDLDRPVQFSNQGRNPHNVTIEEAGIDRNVQPGERWTPGTARELFGEPGTYDFVCKLHADRGMSGVLVIRDPR